MGREELLTAAARADLCKPLKGSADMNALTVVEIDPQPVMFRNLVVINMADEGIPVRAIARSTKVPSDEIYEILKDAFHEGRLIELPKDDWPPGQNRTARSAMQGSPLDNEDNMRIACVTQFKTSRLEASMLMQLLRREHCTKVQLHRVVEDNRPSPGTKDETDIKMVDVIICKLRKKLSVHQIVIETVWGIGYLIKPEQRQLCLSILSRS